MSTYTPEPYCPEGGFSILRLPLLAGILLVTAVVLGGLASFIGRWWYLVVFFPLFMGAGLVVAGLIGVDLAKMRNRTLAVVLGVAGAAVAILALHYLDYLHWTATRDEHFAEMGEEMVRDLASEEAAIDSFPGYLNHKAHEGLRIGKGGGWNVGFYGTWAYWVLEFVIVATLVTWGLIVRATAPFCPACDTWKKETRLGTLQGDPDRVVARLKEGDVRRLREQGPAKGVSLLLSAAICPNCKDRSPIAVKLEKVTKNKKGEESKTELAHLSYPGEALAEFEALFAQKTSGRA
jgi:hypothetical protein